MTVINPAISISKTPHTQTVAFAGTVTFTIGVKNTGDSTLTNVIVTDAVAPGCARTSADIPQLASMAPGDELSYSCTVANVMADFTNVATATGHPEKGPDVTASDSAAVTVGPPPPPVTHPAISVVKDPKSQTVTVGNKATFKITVTNTGDVALTNVTVSDPLLAELQPHDRHARTRCFDQLHLHQGERQVELQQRRGRIRHGRRQDRHRAGHGASDGEGTLRAQESEAEGRLAQEAQGDRLERPKPKLHWGGLQGAAPVIDRRPGDIDEQVSF